MRSPTRTIAATILVLEAFVLFFAALVAKDLSDLSPSTALLGGGGLALLCVLTAGLLRVRAAYVLGWLLQAVMIATGFVVPMMFGIGLIFTALWVFGLYAGARVERERAIVERGIAARDGGSQEPGPRDGATQDGAASD